MNKQALPKHPRYLLIDFENVQKIDLSHIPGDVQIRVFMGQHQKSVSVDLVMQYQKLGSRLEWKPIEGNGKNAVDFVIAYYLGQVFDKDAKAHCAVLSHDKGFDPLMKMLEKEGKDCRRIESISEIK
ncbi:MAG: PIN domain-containing protein [Micavibrio sp.]|nr:PIN domain-containing protein [Micavibrio sp.]